MDKLPPPGSLNFDAGNLSQAWKTWRQHFELFLAATESDRKSNKIRSSILLTCSGSRGREIYNTFEFEGEDDRMDVVSVLRYFEEFCIPRKNIIMLRHKFSIHRQVDGQRFHDFVTDLRKLSEGCELGDLRDSLLRGIIICGLYDNKLRERMLREPDLDLQKAIQLGQAAEDTEQHVSKIDERILLDFLSDSVAAKNNSKCCRQVFQA